MTIYIALLRGINVGGNKIIKMAALKQMFETMGFERVQTYIQSGNVLFESAESAAALRGRIEHEIEVIFGYQVTVVLRTIEEFERIIEHCPYTEAVLSEGETIYVALLGEAPSQEGIDRLLACNSDIDEFQIIGQEVFIYCRQIVRKSMFSNNLLEKKLRVPATSRNWQTTNKLVDLGKSMKA
jgi:uncharacterized protein (DUF1697 family)